MLFSWVKGSEGVISSVLVQEIKFDYRGAEQAVADLIKDWSNNGYSVDIFYDGSSTTSVLLVGKKESTSKKRVTKMVDTVDDDK